MSAIALVVFATSGLGAQRSAAASKNSQPADPVLNAIAVAAEIAPLDSVALQPGYREMRIRSEQSMSCCDPRPMFHLVEGSADVRGTVWLFRTLVLRPRNPAPREDEHCAPLSEQHVCVRQWESGGQDWKTVAERLEQLGAWTLPDPCNTLGARSILIDAGLLSVQRQVGATTSSFTCNAPSYRPRGDVGRELYDLLFSLSKGVPPESIRIVN